MTIEEQIRQRVELAFKPEYIELVNESFMHNVPDGAESHFKLVLVTPAFEGMFKVKRHQSVYKVLEHEMSLIHALALHTLTPEEFAKKSPEAFISPKCRGGSK